MDVTTVTADLLVSEVPFSDLVLRIDLVAILVFLKSDGGYRLYIKVGHSHCFVTSALPYGILAGY